QHRNIVTVFAFGFEEEAPYLVQEYLTGRDLRHVISDREELSVADKVDALRQIAAGLGHAHAEGVIHRDIKPANVRLLEDGTIKIMDFGIAKLAGAETQLTQAGTTMGTATYLSPEQVRGGGIDPRTDIFSLGVLAYELLTYRRPFQGNTLSALIYQILYKPPMSISRVWSDCPESLARVVERCLEKDPDLRYRDTGELAEDLDKVWRPLSSRGVHSRGVHSPGTDTPVVETPPADSGRSFSDEDTQPVPVIALPPDEPPAAAPSAAATTVMPALADPATAPAEPPAPPAEPPAPPAEPELTDTAREIGVLVAQGDLEAARRQLEATIRMQQEEAAETAPPAVPAPGPQPGTGSPAIAAALARLKQWRPRLPAAIPPALKRWLLPAAAALVLLIAVVWWAANRTEAPPVVATPPVTPPPPVAPPPPPPPKSTTGAVAVDALPWARITEITDAEGFVQDLPHLFTTPVLLHLAPGSYRISLKSPEHPDLITCEVEVALDELATCSASFGAATVLDYFKETGWWN
ncbi:MAG: serine/threonine-protein kinase, partial [Thermoanaerobaculia bacterium]